MAELQPELELELELGYNRLMYLRYGSCLGVVHAALR